MEVTREELEVTFRQLSDEELLSRVEAGTLTELALDVATVELRSRGLESSQAPAIQTTLEADDSDIDLQKEGGELVVDEEPE